MIDDNEDISIVIRRCKRSKTEKLELSNRELTSLPGSLFNLKHLIELDLSDNLLQSLNDKIVELVHLEIIDLSNN